MQCTQWTKQELQEQIDTLKREIKEIDRKQLEYSWYNEEWHELAAERSSRRVLVDIYQKQLDQA